MRLSVVVTVTTGGDHVARCLEALAAQRDAPPFEVLVPVDPAVRGVEAWRRAHPEAEFPIVAETAEEAARLHFAGDPGPEHLAYDRPRATGLAAAGAPLVALTEDHARPDTDWVGRIVAAHARLPHAVIGGAIDNRSDYPLTWAVYFCDFGRYQSPLPAGPAGYASDVNVSYKRAALARVEAAWRGAYHETAVHGALRARGETLWLAPEIVVHQERGRLRARLVLRERFAWGRLYAGKRVREMGALRRAAMIVAAPLLPLVLLLRRSREALGRGAQRGAFLRALPWMALLLGAWSLGEWVGYTTGRPTRASELR